MGIEQVLLDDEDKDLLTTSYCWSVCNGYVIRGTHDGKCEYLHLIVLERNKGPRPPNKIADHENRNKLDNRRKNLRWVTHLENSLNNSRSKNKTNIRKLPSGKYQLRGSWPHHTSYGTFDSREEAETYFQQLKENYCGRKSAKATS